MTLFCGTFNLGDLKTDSNNTGSRLTVIFFNFLSETTGNGFIARDIEFQNMAGPQGAQAVALAIASDRAALYSCSISGYQDSLYAVSLRQFYCECDIYGTIDFIFGNAAAVIQTSNLILLQPADGAYNLILANGRTDPG